MDEVIRTLLTMSAVASVIALVLFAAKPLVKNRLPKSFQYYVWLIVTVLLLVPIRLQLPAVGSNSTVTSGAPGNSFPTIRDTVDRYIATTDEAVEHTDTEDDAPHPSDVQSARPDRSFFAGLYIVVIAWALGAALFLLVNIMGYLRFCVTLKKMNIPASGIEIHLLHSLCHKRMPALYRNPAAATPMLIGLFRPVIILPDRDYDEVQLKNILNHELTHLKRRDVAVKWLLTFANAVHWFNPIVYFVRREISLACELSCDETVIKALDREGKQSYGDTLISVVAEGRQPFSVLSATMCEEKKTLKERLEAIVKYKSKSKIIIAVSVAMMMVLSACGLVLGANTVNKLEITAMTANHTENDQLLDDLGYSRDVLEAIASQKTPYVGDNSKVGAIIGQLPIPWEGLSYDGFELQTDQEPYALTIHYTASDTQEISDYTGNPFAASIRENNALLLFWSIDNLSVVNIENPDTMAQYAFTQASLREQFGEIPAMGDIDTLRERLCQNLCMDEFYFSHASRLYLGSVPDEAIYRMGDPLEMTTVDERIRYIFPDGVYSYKDEKLVERCEYVTGDISYDDIIRRFGRPQSQKDIGNLLYISYELRNRNDSAPDIQDKRAYFLFDAGRLVEEGVRAGDDYVDASGDRVDMAQPSDPLPEFTKAEVTE